MTGFSLRWYLMDADNSQLPPVPVWRWLVRLIVLMLQFAPVLRYIDSMRYGLKSRWAGHEERKLEPNSAERKRALHKRIKYYTLMVYEDADATLLRFQFFFRVLKCKIKEMLMMNASWSLVISLTGSAFVFV